MQLTLLNFKCFFKQPIYCVTLNPGVTLGPPSSRRGVTVFFFFKQHFSPMLFIVNVAPNIRTYEVNILTDLTLRQPQAKAHRWGKTCTCSHCGLDSHEQLRKSLVAVSIFSQLHCRHQPQWMWYSHRTNHSSSVWPEKWPNEGKALRERWMEHLSDVKWSVFFVKLELF